MLEIIAVIALCRVNSRNADIRGRSTGWTKFYTVLLWFGFELIGGIFAGIISVAIGMELGMVAYVFALLGAGIGALLSWLIAKRGEPIAVQMGNLSVSETAYIQSGQQLPAPCEVVIIREKSFVGMAAKLEMQLNGQPVGMVGNGEMLSVPAYSAQNIVTGSDAFGMRFKSSAPFDAPPGGRVEVFFKGGKFLPQRTRVYPGAMQQVGAPAPDRHQSRCLSCGAWGFEPQPNCPSCGAPQ